MKNKPSIFISSTVCDFQDLRSALKYHLEELGFSVQLSEYADFEKPIEPDVFEACFESIRRSDIFVLLIGGRRGGWYDEGNRITITRAEYRVAYEQHERGKLVIVPCVRKSTWDQLEGIKEIDRVLKSGGTPMDLSDVSTTHIQDPAHLRAFLDEVRRAKEMKDATAGLGKLPTANWIHLFSNYRELIDILAVALRLQRDLSAQLVLRQVALELADCSRQFLTKSNGRVSCFLDYLDDLLSSLKITSASYLEDPGRKVVISSDQLGLLIGMALSTWLRVPHPLASLERAAYLPALAEYDSEIRSIRPSSVQQACIRTMLAFRALEQHSDDDSKRRNELLKESSGSKGAETWNLRASTILFNTGHFIRAKSALLEAQNLIAHINFERPLADDPTGKLPTTPIQDINKRMVEEEVSVEDVLAWVERQKL